MDKFFNQSVFFLFLGGIFSLILTAVVLFIKQAQKREYGRKLLQERSANNPEVGDIETKLDESVEFQKPNVPELLTSWGLQPLYIITFASLLNQTSHLEIIGLFFLTIIMFLHEFVWVSRFSKKLIYQLIILLLWILFYVVITIKANEKENRMMTNREVQKQN